jgi:hypothetical protein
LPPWPAAVEPGADGGHRSENPSGTHVVTDARLKTMLTLLIGLVDSRKK